MSEVLLIIMLVLSPICSTACYYLGKNAGMQEMLDELRPALKPSFIWNKKREG